ncbi:BnaC03g60440D [Brassica napus]|uniref:BnaC03g60440D protein n=1 Tax=Brassica napus TaxID=3708 RepID=A0A078FJ36_BRANA|nr:BnaC03g60440D [Brassica napus]
MRNSQICRSKALNKSSTKAPAISTSASMSKNPAKSPLKLQLNRPPVPWIRKKASNPAKRKILIGLDLLFMAKRSIKKSRVDCVDFFIRSFYGSVKTHLIQPGDVCFRGKNAIHAIVHIRCWRLRRQYRRRRRQVSIFIGSLIMFLLKS